MTDEEINIAIAEACEEINIPTAEAFWQKPDKRGLGWLSQHEYYEPSPDYCNDLNAMHEAEEKLVFSERKLFRYWLQKVKSSALGNDVMIAIDECVHSTARERAEAYLRTLGQWEEA